MRCSGRAGIPRYIGSACPDRRPASMDKGPGEPSYNSRRHPPRRWHRNHPVRQCRLYRRLHPSRPPRRHRPTRSCRPTRLCRPIRLRHPSPLCHPGRSSRPIHRRRLVPSCRQLPSLRCLRISRRFHRRRRRPDRHHPSTRPLNRNPAGTTNPSRTERRSRLRLGIHTAQIFPLFRSLVGLTPAASPTPRVWPRRFKGASFAIRAGMSCSLSERRGNSILDPVDVFAVGISGLQVKTG